jgi:hypothetical protein
MPTGEDDKWDLDIETLPLVETPAWLAVADAAAQALAAYHQALAVYHAIPQRDMSRLPGFKAACLEVQELEVQRRYQACLACGIDPDRHPDPCIPQESRT